MVNRAIAALVVLVCGLAATALAQPARHGRTTSDLLREANTAALAGNWPRVAALVDPLLDPASGSRAGELGAPDRAEAHRLAGIAAFFHQRSDAAEAHFVAYLRLDLDGQLDPALYPPDVVAFFSDVASRHAAELRALRATPRRSWWLILVPPLGQLQNGDRASAYAVGGALAMLLAVNLTTYAYLRMWCNHTDGTAGGALTCDEDGSDHTTAARRLRPINIGSGIALILTYSYGVYDGIRGYRRRSRESALRPYVDASNAGGVIGITGNF